jgi:protein involved in plasmid replication-relaxation
MSYTTVAKQFIDRDYRLLRGLFESRVMTVKHMADLYFNGNLGAAHKRLWKLKNARLVAERARPRPYDPSILYLTRQGFELLTGEGRLIDYPAIGWQTMQKRTNVSPLTLQHELDVMTAKSAFTTAIAATDTFRIAEFSTWPRLFAFPSKTLSPHGYGKHVWIKPDAFIRVREIDPDGFDATEHFFYLELDRSTEPLSRLQAKAGAYAEQYRSGGLAKRFGAPPEVYEQFPFRVLIVCKSEERRNNIAVAMLARRPPILTLVWLTTFDELCPNALDAIWLRPIDFRESTGAALFDAVANQSCSEGHVSKDACVSDSAPLHAILNMRRSAG